MNKAGRFTRLAGVVAVSAAVLIGCGGKNAKDKAGTFIDSRDKKVYRTVAIGGQTWMARNLDYRTGGECREGEDANCEKYGALYDWDGAMKACPAGWHLPTAAEWQTLVDFAGGDKDAGKKLKAKTGWGEQSGGTDDYGFAALPGGAGRTGGLSQYFGSMGVDGGVWWTSTVAEEEGDGNYAYFLQMFYYNDDNDNNPVNSVLRNADVKAVPFSVRCVQDAAETEQAGAGQSAELPADSVRVIDKTCFIVVYPELDEEYVDETGDLGFYTGNALGRFEEIGLATIGISAGGKERYLSFALDDGKTHVIDLKDKSDAVDALLYKKGNKPIKIWIDSEQPVAYNLGDVAKCLGFKPIELMKKAGLTYGSFRDYREGHDRKWYDYKVVLIGEQIWMAENLAYEAKGSMCYDNDEKNCQRYGRLYNWETAKKACPAGMHLPSNDEWAKLAVTAGGEEWGGGVAGKKLKSKDGWESVWGDNAAGEYVEIPGGGSNDYDFSALPGGSSERGHGVAGYWWTSTENEEDDDKAKVWNMVNASDMLAPWSNTKERMYSVRCVVD
jgi:uncharacterized protein (TIGR02145 family)